MSPDVSVVIASHGRPIRLRWLLNALEEQTLQADRWDVTVVHDYDTDTAARIFDDHGPARQGRLHQMSVTRDMTSPARQRNIGWRAATGALVAFVDDDCRPDPRWLELLVEEAGRHPGAFVQGATRPDPFEHDVFAAPHPHTVSAEPPNRFAQSCNILYPRSLLEQLGGFEEKLVTGEDFDLSIRARGLGAAHVGAPEAVVFHAVEAMTLPESILTGLKWRHLALVAKRHPHIRRSLTLRMFWEPDHLLVTLLLVGAVASRRCPGAGALALPWVAKRSVRRGRRPVDVAVSVLELPGRAVDEVARVLTFAAGSVRHRTLVL
jgi:GT2 family glycosyltransferase